LSVSKVVASVDQPSVDEREKGPSVAAEPRKNRLVVSSKPARRVGAIMDALPGNLANIKLARLIIPTMVIDKGSSQNL
jgi:hypothetical protein